MPEPEQYASFLEVDYEKLPVLNYRDRIRWVWTRKEDDISMSPQVQKYLWEVSTELNKKFNTHIRLFGTEAWQKLARIAVASAGLGLARAETRREKLGRIRSGFLRASEV